MLKKGFTLAEVLITLAVIGIVAALTIGIFLPKIHSQIRARQIATAEVKFTKAMEQMALNNAIGPYYETTQEFVDELQNYLKIAKVCDNEHLEDCFGYEKIKAGEDEFEIKNLKSGKDDFGMNANGTDYGETIGIITIDGTSMLLSWNKNCPILEPKVYQWGNNTNETTSCVAMVMDVNTDKSPNTLNKDVALFRANRVGQACGMKFTVGTTTYCWGAPFVADKPLTDADCNTNKDTYGIPNCISDNSDYWGYAMKTCKTQGKRLPTKDELTSLALYLYQPSNINDTGYTYDITLNTNALEDLSEVLLSKYTTSNPNWFFLWSDAQSLTYNAWYRFFAGSGTQCDTASRKSSSYLAVCVP